MPIVFVHGVNNRMGPSYLAGVKVTKAYLEQSFANVSIGGKKFGNKPSVVFPYWGDLATSFAWNMASLPRGEMQSLGAACDVELRAQLATIQDALGRSAAGLDEPLIALAKRDFGIAVEFLTSLALSQAPAPLIDEVAEFVVEAETYAAAVPNPLWLAKLTTDDQFIGSLQQAIAQNQPGSVQSQGISDVVDAIKGAAIKLKTAAQNLVGSAVDHVGDFASTKLLSWTREELNATLGRFFGDIFIYLNGRGDDGAPGEIPKRVLGGYQEAIGNGPATEPFVVIGHSLGGVISFDLLSHFRPDLNVDLFVSVGSQVAHFEEMKLYRVSDKTIVPPRKAATPANITRWINVYDEVDIFSYRITDVFDRFNVDARYDTKTYVIKAHGEYFHQRRFYERLRDRVSQLP